MLTLIRGTLFPDDEAEFDREDNCELFTYGAAEGEGKPVDKGCDGPGKPEETFLRSTGARPDELIEGVEEDIIRGLC